jgi:DNA-binding MarR family transcriptional regulator
MVKSLDDPHPLLPEHIGVDLWHAATAWRTRLHQQMVARGHPWYGDARGAIASYLDPRGMSQSELVSRMGLSKQAVQQLLDGLEADGIVRRVADPNDRRGNRVEYTAEGLAALRDAVKIKRRMELEIRERIGNRAFDALRTALREVALTWKD